VIQSLFVAYRLFLFTTHTSL